MNPLNPHYFYLIWGSIFLLVWLALFLFRKDVRREMLFVSILYGFGGLAGQKIHIVDWWQPLTITNTPVGIEDFLIGFCIGGVAAVIYEEVYKKHLSKRKSTSLPPKEPWAFLFGFPLTFLVLFFILNVESFYAAGITSLIFIAYMLYMRRDLIKDSIFSGLLILVIGIGIYYLLFLFYPGYIQRFWYLPDKWYSSLVLGIPIAEYIWYFLIGMYTGPLYEFIKKVKVFK